MWFTERTAHVWHAIGGVRSLLLHLQSLLFVLLFRPLELRLDQSAGENLHEAVRVRVIVNAEIVLFISLSYPIRPG